MENSIFKLFFIYYNCFFFISLFLSQVGGLTLSLQAEHKQSHTKPLIHSQASCSLSNWNAIFSCFPLSIILFIYFVFVIRRCNENALNSIVRQIKYNYIRYTLHQAFRTSLFHYISSILPKSMNKTVKLISYCIFLMEAFEKWKLWR